MVLIKIIDNLSTSADIFDLIALEIFKKENYDYKCDLWV